MRRKIAVLIGLMLVLSLGACVTRLTDFTVISSKNVDLSKMATYKRASSRVEGEDIVRIIIIFPTAVRSDLKEALDRAIEAVPGAVALVDGVISIRNFYIPFIYGEIAYLVEGTPLIDPEMAAEKPLQSDYIVYLASGDEDEDDIRYIEEEEFIQLKKSYEEEDVKEIEKILAEI